MSVTGFSENFKGRSGREEYLPTGITVTTHTRTFLVATGNKADDDTVILSYSATPKIGASHPNHANARCNSRQAQPVSDETKFHWMLVVNYTTQWDIREDPLDDPAKTTWATESYQTPVFEEINGNAIVNAASDPFDPPAEKDDSRWTSVTSKNIPNAVPAWMFAYQDGVNSDSFTVDGKLIAAGEGKVSAIHLAPVQERNEIEYRVLTVTIHYRGEGDDAGSSGYGSGSGSDEIEPWDLSLLNAGLREVISNSAGDTLRNITDDMGSEVAGPVPLDADGAELQNPTPGTVLYLQFEVYRKRTFALIEDVLS